SSPPTPPASARPFLSSFFFNATPTTALYTLSLHDALPISFAPKGWVFPPGRDVLVLIGASPDRSGVGGCAAGVVRPVAVQCIPGDRKSTRLNSSHVKISYAVFCLKKKKTIAQQRITTYRRA